MDFFSYQDHARRNTRYLLVLFFLVVIFFVLLVNVLFGVALFSQNAFDDSSASYSYGYFFSWAIFGKTSFGVCLVIGCAVLYKWLQLAEGGRKVAESLGGRPISHATNDPSEKRLLNVVEEMALASGMPVPPVYLLDSEWGINAFAAGKTPADAVIGVTKGTIEILSRDQLQGVVAHEFSHILNGDMKLNFRLVCLLNGILFIAGLGEFLLRIGSFGSSRSRSSDRISGDIRILALGFGLFVVGWLGAFFSGLIKAAINKQREFLADASAVQFTRNPQGIGEALKTIGGYSRGSRVISGNAGEASHMFISNALGMLVIFDTHPPLEKRILRIDPGWDGKMTSVDNSFFNVPKKNKGFQKKEKGFAVAGAVLGSVLASQDGALNDAIAKPGIDLTDPLTCESIIYYLLLDTIENIRSKQIEIIEELGAPGVMKIVSDFGGKLEKVDKYQALPLVSKVMPVLKCMSKKQYLAFKRLLVKLIKADGRVELFEWCVFNLVKHYLGAHHGDNRVVKQKHRALGDVQNEYCLVLSTIIHNCHLDKETASRAFTRGASTAGAYEATLLPEESCNMAQFEKSVRVLAGCYPLLKARILKGMVNSVQFDGVVTPLEKDLITCIAALMDSPVPRLSLSGKK